MNNAGRPSNLSAKKLVFIDPKIIHKLYHHSNCLAIGLLRGIVNNIGHDSIHFCCQLLVFSDNYHQFDESMTSFE